MRFLLLALICLLSLPSFATPTKAKTTTTTDQLINANYPLFTKAFTELDPEVTAEIYSKDASYLSESQSKEIYYGRESIVAIYQRFFDKIRNKKARIDIDFRVLNRKLSGNSAFDTGYYLVRFYPAEETGEPVSEFAGKFVIGTQKDSQQRWNVTLDMNNRAEPSFYLNAKPVPNLYYGRQFPPLPDSQKKKQ
ncbi:MULTISPECIES: YybH family protein [Shewanella]|jgi:hypothetical protein|uniref:DUF4440 domain-containing protein n=4 Tax=Shewanellaceae TaxID=267890 RepID=A0A5B8QXH4_9GAMM|nr:MULTISPECIES: DUF4440 domain-containing protein [Shewanella]ESE41016.1 extracytoplasmic protein [Shewanella decolorationis S12]QDZ90719.1 DUF4440 domain-containing protein [Shewanella decolorationis]QYK07351.1 DUF4440 domain-containing protein [Shewanella mangrovisoli]